MSGEATQKNTKSSCTGPIPQSGTGEDAEPTECPKCGFHTVRAGQCDLCGIIVARYLERMARERSEPAEEGLRSAGKRPYPRSGVRGFDGNPLERWLGPFRQGMALWQRLENRLTPDRAYVNRLADSLFQGLVILLITLLFYAGLLHLLRAMWIFYVETPVGMQFVQGYPERAREILHLLHQASLLFAFEVTITAFLICLAFGAACRILHITTLLYNSIGAFGRVLLCGIPLAGVVAWWIGPGHGFDVWSVAYAVAFVPTLCVYPVCFRISSALFPELGWVLRRAGLLGSGMWERLEGHIRTWLQKPRD